MRIKLAATATLLTLATTATAHMKEHTKVLAFDAAAGDRFGASVAIFNNVSVVGAPGDDDNGSGSGSAYVYTRTNAFWNFETKLTPTVGFAGERFGAAMAMSGNTLVVGAPDNEVGSTGSGSAYVFVRTGTTWTQEAQLTPSDGLALDAFGASVSISGDTIAVGSPFHTESAVGSGAVYVYTRSGTTWTEEATFDGGDSTAGDRFGWAVSVDNDRLVAGAPLDSDIVIRAGSAYIFSRAAAVWSLDQKIVEPLPSAGDNFGASVSLQDSWDQLVVGEPFDDDEALDGGSVLLFDDVAGTWTLNQKITDPLQTNGDQSGSNVLVVDEFVFTCAELDDELANDAGKTWLFIDNGVIYYEEALVASDPFAGQRMGSSIAFEGCWGVTGATGDNTQGVETGAAYIFDLGYPPVPYCTSGTSASGCTPVIVAVGHASATDTAGFFLRALGVEGDKDGLFFWSTNGQQANSWGSGTSFQCVIPPVLRGGLVPGTGTAGECDGFLSQDMNALWCSICPKPAKNPGPGVFVQAQAWYRDPFNTSNQTTSLTNAVEFEVCP